MFCHAFAFIAKIFDPSCFTNQRQNVLNVYPLIIYLLIHHDSKEALNDASSFIRSLETLDPHICKVDG